MAKRIRPVSHEERLSVVEHLEELRNRLIFTLVAFTAALAVAFWQNKRVLDIVNGPLPDDRVPSTFGVSEAFMSTITVSTYAALIITLPIILWQLYAFVIPAFSEQERRVAKPLLLMVPVLFLAGVVFGYFLVLPAAVGFLLNFNDDEFNILLRAREYYSFFGLTELAMGMLFQLPLAILIATRLGFVTPAQLRANRRYAVLVIAVLAMLLPGTDPISMLIEMVPLVLLYEGSIWIAAWLGRPGGARAEAHAPPTAQSAETPPVVR